MGYTMSTVVPKSQHSSPKSDKSKKAVDMADTAYRACTTIADVAELEFLEERNTPRLKPDNEVMLTFGKYKGKPVVDVVKFDNRYATWLHKQDWIKKFDDIYRVLNKKLQAPQ